MEIERAIDILKMENDLIQFNPTTGDNYPIELQNQDNQNLYNANLVAISALEKMYYFRNCKDCICLDYIEEGKEKIPYCSKVDCCVIDPENDGCSFYEVLEVEE